MPQMNTGQVVKAQEYYPQAERSLLLRTCRKCKKLFKGHYYADTCEREECQPPKLEASSNLKGQKRGTLLVKQLARVTSACSYWRCLCDCGRTVVKPEPFLDSKHPTCGKDCPVG